MQDTPTSLPSAANTAPNMDLNPLITALQLGNQVASKTAEAITHAFVQHGRALNHLNILYSSNGTLVIEGDGYLCSVSVIVPCTTSSLSGYAYDAAAAALSSDSNRFLVLPTSGFWTYDFPFTNGLVIKPSSISSHTVAVSYVERHI